MTKLSRPTPPSLTPSQLKDASMQVFYEVKMFAYCVTQLSALEKRQSKFGRNRLTHPDLMSRNVLLEAFWIHSKSLIQFFFAARNKSNDICAEDFGFVPTDELGFTEAIRKNALANVDHKLAHFDRARTSVDPNTHPFETGHVGGLLRLIDQFSTLRSVQSYPGWIDSDKLVRLTFLAVNGSMPNGALSPAPVSVARSQTLTAPRDEMLVATS